MIWTLANCEVACRWQQNKDRTLKPSELRMFLNHLCDLAKEETLPRFRTRNKITNKQDTGFDPVTDADREAERVISAEIRKNWPEHGIVGEEHGTSNRHAEYQWIIDPIDGTRSFITGVPVWGTLIGFYHNGHPLAGVMDQPFTQERFLCDGNTATVSIGTKAFKLQTANTKTLSQACLMTTAPELYSADTSEAFQRLSTACRLTRYGTDCYAFGMLAMGSVDIVIECGVQLYDVAALVPIIEMAGGVFTDWQGNQNPEGGNVIAAANLELHQQAISLLNN